MNNLWERGWASLAWREKSSLSREVCDQLTRGIHAATTTTSSPVMSRTGFIEDCIQFWNEEKNEIAFIKSCPKNQNMHCALLQRQNVNHYTIYIISIILKWPVQTNVHPIFPYLLPLSDVWCEPNFQMTKLSRTVIHRCKVVSNTSEETSKNTQEGPLNSVVCIQN